MGMPGMALFEAWRRCSDFSGLVATRDAIPRKSHGLFGTARMASSQHRVQAYLEKHKIGTLFEGLMLRLTRDTPEEPLTYLIETLTKKLAKTKPVLSVTNQKLSVEHATTENRIPDQLRRTINDFRSVLAADTSAAAAGDESPTKRDYPKPWKVNSAKGMGTDHVENDRQHKSTGVIIHHPLGSKTSEAIGARTTQPSTTKGTTVTQNDRRRASKADSALTLVSAADTLANELRISTAGVREAAACQERSPSASEGGTVEYHGLSKLHAIEVHKAKLHTELAEQLRVGNGKQENVERGINLSSEETRRQRMVLSENLGLLEDGLTAVTRAPLPKDNTRRQSVQHENNLAVAVCAVCARMLTTGDIGTRSIVSSASGRLSKASSEVTLRTHSAAAATPAEQPDFTPVTSARRTGYSSADDGEEEEAFESVSQVSGPRVPVWSPPVTDRAQPVAATDNAVGRGASSGLRESLQQLNSNHSKTTIDKTEKSLRAENLKHLPVSSQIDRYFTSDSASRLQQLGRSQGAARYTPEDVRGVRATEAAEERVAPFGGGARRSGWRT